MKHALLVGLCAAVAACDPLATGGFRPPFVTINGTIDQSPTMPAPIADGSTIRVALLWQNDQSPSTNYSEQLVDVTAHFPAMFSADIASKPNAPVIHSLPTGIAAQLGLDPAMQWATATLVVYSDDDRNGTLTIVDSGHSSDRVLAATNDLDLFFLAAGKPAPANLIGIFPTAPDFSLVRNPPPRDPLPGECGSFSSQGHFTDLCPNVDAVPTPLDPATLNESLSLVDDATLQKLTCSSFWGLREFPDWDRPDAQICDGGVCPICRGFQCPLDLPGPSDAVTCAADKLSYVYKHCADDPNLCGTRFCHFGHGERLAADPPPAGWPCN